MFPAEHQATHTSRPENDPTREACDRQMAAQLSQGRERATGMLHVQGPGACSKRRGGRLTAPFLPDLTAFLPDWKVSWHASAADKAGLTLPCPLTPGEGFLFYAKGLLILPTPGFLGPAVYSAGTCKSLCLFDWKKWTHSIFLHTSNALGVNTAANQTDKVLRGPRAQDTQWALHKHSRARPRVGTGPRCWGHSSVSSTRLWASEPTGFRLVC